MNVCIVASTARTQLFLINLIICFVFSSDVTWHSASLPLNRSMGVETTQKTTSTGGGEEGANGWPANYSDTQRSHLLWEWTLEENSYFFNWVWVTREGAESEGEWEREREWEKQWPSHEKMTRFNSIQYTSEHSKQHSWWLIFLIFSLFSLSSRFSFYSHPSLSRMYTLKVYYWELHGII